MQGPHIEEASTISELLLNKGESGEFIYIQLEMQIGDQNFWEQGVLDTGSKRSCINRDFIESNGLSRWTEENDNKLIGVNGEQLIASETITAEIMFQNGTSLRHEWIIVDACPVNILIGTDIMRKHGPVTLDFDNNTAQDAADTILLNTSPLEENKNETVKSKERNMNNEKIEKMDDQEIPMKIFEGSKLTDDEIDQVKKLIAEFKDIIITKNSEAICKNYEASIPILDTAEAFTHVKPYPIHLNYQERAKKIIDKWLEEGKIEKTQSPYNAPVVIVEKKLAEGETIPKLRLCIDYRRLNQNIAADPCITERLNDILAQTTRHKYRSSFDMPSAYLQIPLKKEDRHKTAFLFLGTQYQFTCCPFGLNVSGSAFQRCMFALMEGLDRRHIRSYVDDVLLTTETFHEHLSVMRQFFMKVRQHGMTLAYDKMTIGQHRLLFLGMELTDEGFGINPKKIEGLTKITELKSKKDARSYLGCLGFFKSHIKAFSEKTKAISDSLQGKNFTFTDEMKAEMEEMKKVISSRPVRAYPQLGIPFILYTDASQHTLAYALCQVQDGIERVIHDGGAKIPADKLHLCIFEKEMMAVKHALKSERYLLRGAEFILRTDSLAVKNCLEPKANEPREFPNDKVARWCQAILDFRFKLEKIKSEENVLADAISRLPREDTNEAKDNEILIIDQWDEKSEIEKIMTHVHDDAGHGGVNRTLKILRKSYKLPNDRKLVTNWVQSCLYCQKFRHYTAKGISANITNYARPKRALERVQVDLHFVSPVTIAGYRYIMGIVCELTSYARFYPLKSKSASETAKRIGAFLNEEGASVVKIKTDLGTEFLADFITTVQDHGVAIEKATPYWKKKNAIVERAFGKLKACLKSISNRNNRNWVINLGRANMLYNSLPLQDTGLSPFQTVYGHLSRQCQELVDERSEDEIRAIIEEKWSKWGNENHKPPTVSYHVNEKILIRIPPKAGNGFNARYGQIYQGPFTIVSKINESTYMVDVNGKHTKKNVAQIRPFIERMKPEEIYESTAIKKNNKQTASRETSERQDQISKTTEHTPKIIKTNKQEPKNTNDLKVEMKGESNINQEDIYADQKSEKDAEMHKEIENDHPDYSKEISELFMENKDTLHLFDSIINQNDEESDETIEIAPDLDEIVLDEIEDEEHPQEPNQEEQLETRQTTGADDLDTDDLISRCQTYLTDGPYPSTLESDELTARMDKILTEYSQESAKETQANNEESDFGRNEEMIPNSESTPMTKPIRRSKRDLTVTNAKIKKHST